MLAERNRSAHQRLRRMVLVVEARLRDYPYTGANFAEKRTRLPTRWRERPRRKLPPLPPCEAGKPGPLDRQPAAVGAGGGRIEKAERSGSRRAACA